MRLNTTAKRGYGRKGHTGYWLLGDGQVMFSLVNHAERQSSITTPTWYVSDVGVMIPLPDGRQQPTYTTIQYHAFEQRARELSYMRRADYHRELSLGRMVLWARKMRLHDAVCSTRRELCEIIRGALQTQDPFPHLLEQQVSRSG